jgi:hypothetical protein
MSVKYLCLQTNIRTPDCGHLGYEAMWSNKWLAAFRILEPGASISNPLTTLYGVTTKKTTI